MCTRVKYLKSVNLVKLGFDLSVLDRVISQKRYDIIGYYCGLKCNNNCVTNPPISTRDYKSISDIIERIGLIFIYVNDSKFIIGFAKYNMQQFRLSYDLGIDEKRPTQEEITKIRSLVNLMYYLNVDLNKMILSFHKYVDDYMYLLELWRPIGDYMVYKSNVISQNPT